MASAPGTSISFWLLIAAHSNHSDGSGWPWPGRPRPSLSQAKLPAGPVQADQPGAGDAGDLPEPEVVVLPGLTVYPVAVAQVDDNEVAAPGDRVPRPGSHRGPGRSAARARFSVTGSSLPRVRRVLPRLAGWRGVRVSRAIATAGDSPARNRSIIEVTAADSGSVPGSGHGGGDRLAHRGALGEDGLGDQPEVPVRVLGYGCRRGCRRCVPRRRRSRGWPGS